MLAPVCWRQPSLASLEDDLTICRSVDLSIGRLTGDALLALAEPCYELPPIVAYSQHLSRQLWPRLSFRPLFLQNVDFKPCADSLMALHLSLHHRIPSGSSGRGYSGVTSVQRKFANLPSQRKSSEE